MAPSDIVELLPKWPHLATGSNGPSIRYWQGSARMAYDTPDESVAVAVFPLCLQLVCGHPNDEALQCHPLYAKGLTRYSVHRIKNSSRLAAMEKANAVHPRHESASYLKNKEHWIFTFQDATVELLVFARSGLEPCYKLLSSWREANELLANNIENI